MSYIPDDGPDMGLTARSYWDRRNAISDHWPVLSKHVIDFGAYRGRLANDLADSHKLFGVAIEGEYDLMHGDRVTNVREHVTPRRLGSIIRDYPNATVLALSVLHHLPEWRKYVGAIERNASYAFIETAHPDEVLPDAVAHDQSAAITAWCEKRGVKIHESPGWDRSQLRPTWFTEF